MTREEALDILSDNHTVLYSHGDYTEQEENEALSMAIKSLEAWGKVEADILGLDGYYDDAFWEGTYAVSKIIGKHLAEVSE